MDASDYLWNQKNTSQKVRLAGGLTSFITEERAQKFELLTHLLTNLKQTLIVCGPEGIGKTTLLMTFKELNADAWPIILLSATEQLSFESVQAQLVWVLSRNLAGVSVQNLSAQLRQLEKQNQRLVLMIDDAGNLVAGFMTSLMQYAAMHPCLRVVFALTDEELKRKRIIEQGIEECHFIEIPPLSLHQSKEYLLDLLGKPERTLFGDGVDADYGVVDNVIRDEMVKQIYKKTRGVPGKISEELPHFLNANTVKGMAWIYILAFACVVAIGASVMIWRNSGTDSEQDVYGGGVASGTTKTVTAPLLIPGQSAPDPEISGAEKEQDNSARSSKMPETSASEPDYYAGYARVREKDALDEYQANKDSGLSHDEAAEQPKIEIIPSEPPVTVKAPSNQPAPVMGSNGTDAPAAVKLVSKQMAKSVLDTTKPQQSDTLESVVKPDVRSNSRDQKSSLSAGNKHAASKAVQLVKTTPKVVSVKKPVHEKPLPARVKTPPEPVAKVDVTQKPKAVIKPDVNPKTGNAGAKQTAQLKEPLTKPKAVKQEAVAETAKTNTSVTKKNPEELVGLARLGVVMKYKSDIVKPGEIKPDTLKHPLKPSVEKSLGDVYTLQVMVFSQRQTLQDFMRKHGALGANLRYITSRKGGSEKYVVMYGAFKSIAEANAAKQKLPADFKRAYARKK